MTSQESSLKINEALKDTLNEFLKFPLSEAIAGRRARRFCVGAEIPDGVLSFKSTPKLSNYCTSPVGRTFPSAVGFITSELFYTDDNGTYILPTRDFHPEIEIIDGKVNLEEFFLFIKGE